MKRFIFGLCAGLAMAFPAYVIAQDSLSDKPQIIVDEENEQVVLLVKGKSIAVFSAEGLHVEGDFTYSGTLRDVGENGGVQ